MAKNISRKVEEEISDLCAEVKFEVETVYVPKTILIHLPKLPITTLQQINSFMAWCSSKHDCEGIVSLTLDDNNEWLVIPWYQEAQGSLHVKFNMHDEKNTEEYGHLYDKLDKVHCTIHSHNKTTAFQSSDDADDELQKNGWHMTIGKCNTAGKDYHLRYNFRKNARFDEEGIKIAPAMQQFIEIDTKIIIDIDIPDEYKDYSDMIIEGEMSKELEHPPEWENYVTKKKSYGGYGYGSGGRTIGFHTGQNQVQQQMALNGMGGFKEEELVALKAWDASDIN